MKEQLLYQSKVKKAIPIVFTEFVYFSTPITKRFILSALTANRTKITKFGAGMHWDDVWVDPKIQGQKVKVRK